MKLQYPTRSLTWGKEPLSDNYLSGRCDMMIEIFNQNGTLIKRKINRGGGVHPENNHTEPDLDISDNEIITVKFYNLSTIRLPIQLMIINSQSDDDEPSLFPRGEVNGNGSVDNSNIPLWATVLAGQKATMRFRASLNTHSWWRINCNAWFFNTDIENPNRLSSKNPNDSTDYNANKGGLSIVYENSKIRWSDGDIDINEHIVIDNSPTLPTESGVVANPWYVAQTSQCDIPEISIVLSPSKSIFNVGENLSISCNANNATHYQLYKDNQKIGIQQEFDIFTIQSVNQNSSGTYQVEAINICGSGKTSSSQRSNSISITVQANTTGFLLQFDPIVLGNCEGEQVEYSYSPTITDGTDPTLVWASEITVQSEGTYRFFIRLVNNHSIWSSTGLINTSEITQTYIVQ